MLSTTIKAILNTHGVPYFEKDGRIYADSMIAYTKPFEYIEDVTDWSKQQLFSWLGY